MTSRWSVRHWESQGGRGKRAAELVPQPSCEPLTAALRRMTADPGEIAFLVLRVDGLDTGALHGAVDAFHAAGGSARVCLAGNRLALTTVAASDFDIDRVGLMLDDVDIRTPLADLVWDRIEACRFDPNFIARARREIRLGCALESMLALARDLGVCTLGSNDEPGSAGLSDRAEFNYRPCASLARSPVKRAKSVGRASPGHSAQPMIVRSTAGNGTDFSSR